MDLVMVSSALLYELFSAIFILSIGSCIIVFVTALFAHLVWEKEYWDCVKMYSKASAALFAAAGVILLVAMVFAQSTNPTPEMVLPFSYSFWGAPLTGAFVLIAATTVIMLLQYKTQRPFGTHSTSSIGLTSLLTGLGAFTGILSLLFYNLINSYMVTPNVPDGLGVVVQQGGIDPLTQLGEMVNRTWIPLSIKISLIGALSFSVLFSGAAAVRRMRSKGNDEEEGWLDFVTSWGFKTGILFGAPLPVVGYWTASILHTSVPTFAFGLMGVAEVGLSSALVNGMGPLWAVGTGTAMALGALAGVYYLSRGRGKVRQGSTEQRVLRLSVPWIMVLFILVTYAVLYVGVWYPYQFVLVFAILVDGIVLFEAVRRYALGKIRLWVPALIFTMSCYGLLVYQAPNTLWYDAAAFGGICWPLIGFPLLAVTVYYFCTRWSKMKYAIPIFAMGMCMLIVTVKTADVELVKGQTLVAIDPTVTNIVQSWAYLNGYSTAFLNLQYPIPGNWDLLLALIFTFFALLGIYYLVTRQVVSRPLISAAPVLHKTLGASA
jgi:hypothetical protein